LKITSNSRDFFNLRVILLGTGWVVNFPLDASFGTATQKTRPPASFKTPRWRRGFFPEGWPGSCCKKNVTGGRKRPVHTSTQHIVSHQFRPPHMHRYFD